MHANMLRRSSGEKKEWDNEKKWEFSFLVQKREILIKMLKSNFFAQGF
jgi:hypothetical protein